MPNLVSPKRERARAKETKRFCSVVKKIEGLESRIRSDYTVSNIKVRVTGKVSQLIWKRVDFLEFDKQCWTPTNLNSIEPKLHLKFSSESPALRKSAIYSEGKGFLYCRYKCIDVKRQKKLILIEKHPILMTPGRSRRNIIKALNMLSEILECSKELKDISLVLRLSWQIGVKSDVGY